MKPKNNKDIFNESAKIYDILSAQGDKTDVLKASLLALKQMANCLDIELKRAKVLKDLGEKDVKIREIEDYNIDKIF